ncbi:MAG: lamin tail domain-containing protein, partial [Myxococcota bacterium]
MVVALLAGCSPPAPPRSVDPAEPEPPVESGAPPAPPIAVRINELMPGNLSTTDGPDPAVKADWVELVNAGDDPAPLERVFLRSDDGDASIWQGPAGVALAPGERVVV